MNFIIYKYRTGLVFVILVLISLGLISIRSTSFRLYVNGFIQTIAWPFVYLFGESKTGVVTFFSDISEGIEKLDELAAIRDELRDQVDNKNLIKRLYKENQRLKELLNIKESFSAAKIDTELAYIIANVSHRNHEVYIIDKGRSQGIKENMPVITYNIVKDESGQNIIEKFIVGIVIEVFPWSSKILPVTDEDFNITVKFKKSDYIGYLRGRGLKYNDCIVEQINTKAEILINDVVVSAGGVSKFPEGLKIGYAKKIVERKDTLSKNVYITPYMRYSPSSEVFVIKTKPNEELLMILDEMK